MTYGWAILIISIVLASLWSLGLFSRSPTGGGGAACVGTVGYMCGTPLLASNGLLLTSIGQTASGSAITVTGLGCSNTSAQPTSFSSTSLTLPPSQSASVAFSCSLPTSTVGSTFSGTLWMQYNLGGATGLISRIGTISAKVTEIGTSFAGTYAWTSQSGNLNYNQYDLSCATTNGYIYCMGGNSNPSMVQYAQTLGGGGTTVWAQSANNLAVGTSYQSCVMNTDNYIYCLGGGPSSTVQYARALNGGDTTTWISQSNTLTTSTDYFSCVISNGYIYCMGGIVGGNPSTTVQDAQVLNGGGTTAWSAQSNSIIVDRSESCVTANSYIYCMGGYQWTGATNTVQYAQILSPGLVGQWQTTSPLVISESEENCAIANGYIYCMGGNTGSYVTTVQYSQIRGGSLGPWQTTNSLVTAEGGNSCVIANNNYIYCIGVGSNIQYAYV